MFSPFIGRDTSQRTYVLMQICVWRRPSTRDNDGNGGNGNGERSTISQIEMVPSVPFFRGV